MEKIHVVNLGLAHVMLSCPKVAHVICTHIFLVRASRTANCDQLVY